MTTPTCAKQGYPTERAAKTAMRHVLSKPRGGKKGWGQPGAYRCEFCNRWHWGRRGHRA